FGNQDESSSFLRYLKLAVGLSYELTETLSIGVAPSVGYSDISLRLFPHTSVAPSPGLPTGFAGLDIRDDCSKSGGLGSLVRGCPSDFVASVKVGAIYRPSSWLALGATYTSPVEFDYGDGRAGIDFSAVGLGRVNYDARVSGIPWPQEV